jgi:hypothetical protein
LEGIKGEIEIIGKDFNVAKEGYKTGTFIIRIETDQLRQRKTPIVIGVYQGDKKIKTSNTTFMGPAQ